MICSRLIIKKRSLWANHEHPSPTVSLSHACNTHMLACKCMLSLVCRTRTNTHTHPGTGLPHCQADITSTVKRAIQIWRVIKLAKYIKSTWCTVWCVSIYRQHGWNRTRGHRNSASNRSLKMVLALELLQKTPLSSHLNDIYFGLLQDVGRYTSKLCETVLTFHNDLPIWSAEVKNSRSEQRWSVAEVETGDFQQGSVSVKKPEDPGYLLLLAAPQTKRGLNTFFPVWLQTMRGFEAVHDSHGNGFWVPTIMCISFLEGVINDHKAENAKRGRFEALTLAFSRKSRTQQRDNKTKSQQVSYLWHQLAFHQHL